jgi:prephenate dehydrogenase
MMAAMQIGVIGLGRFGSLWARLLAAKGGVLGYNRSPGRPTPAGVTAATLEQVCACDTLFLCVSISAVEETALAIADHIRPGTVVLDTCSVKEYPLSVLRKTLPEEVGIIGTHPMFGPDSVKDGLNGLPMIICRERADEEIVQFWIDRFCGLGLSVIEMTAAEHDREAAYTQGITHFVGRVLRELDVQPSRIATLGYRKILEVVEQTCNDPMQLFVDLQRHNRFTVDMRRDLTAAFSRIVDKLGPQPVDSDTPDRGTHIDTTHG